MEKIRRTVILLIPMALWGSLFSCIKIGYNVFSINDNAVPDILMFAAYRFAFSGIVVCGISLLRKEKLERPIKKSVYNIVHMGLWAIVLHYAFTYVGLSMTDSSKSALIKQVGVLVYICFAFLFFREEKFSIVKICGAVLGFAGVVAINYGNGSISFSIGDILILLASLCTVVSSVMTRKYVQGSSPFWVTGISQLAGGLILLIVAFAMGGKALVFTWKSTLVFGYICAASIIAYVLWNSILRSNNLSKLFVIKFAEPLFACVFGAVLLGEDIFKIQYLAAFVLISLGIVLGNRTD